MTPAAATVLVREAVRVGRRARTWLLRVGFAAVLFGLVLWTWVQRMQVIALDPSLAAQLGYDLFQAYVGVQLGLAALIAPIVVGLGIVEEREEGTLDLLTLTGLQPWQILWGKVLSRLLFVLTLVLGSAPILGMVLSFGGVPPIRILTSVVNTAVVVVVLAGIGGFTALFTRGGLASLAAAFGYALLGFGLVPALFTAVSGLPGRHVGSLSPLVGVWEDHGWGLLPALAFLPALAGIAQLAAPIFRMATSDDEETEAFGQLSPDVWVVERVKVRAWIAAIVAGGGFLALLLVEGTRSTLVSAEHQAIAAWGLATVALYATTVLYGLTIGWASRWWQGWNTGSAALAGLHWDEEAPRRRWARRLRGKVWRNPVAWREIVTSPRGSGNRMVRWATLAWMAFVAMTPACAAFDEEIYALLGLPAVLLGLVATALAAAGPVVAERKTGALAVLLTTTLSAGRGVRGKLAAMAAQGLPPLLLGATLIASAVWWDSWQRVQLELSWGDGGNLGWMCAGGATELTAGVLAVKAAWTLAWLIASWCALAVGILGLALRLRPPGLVPAATLLAALLFHLGPVLGGVLIFERDFEGFAKLWLPLLSDGWSRVPCRASDLLPLSAAFFLGLAAVGYVGLVARLRPWIGDER